MIQLEIPEFVNAGLFPSHPKWLLVRQVFPSVQEMLTLWKRVFSTQVSAPHAHKLVYYSLSDPILLRGRSDTYPSGGNCLMNPPGLGAHSAMHFEFKHEVLQSKQQPQLHRELVLCFVDTSLRRINLSQVFEKKKKKIVETLRKGFGWIPYGQKRCLGCLAVREIQAHFK